MKHIVTITISFALILFLIQGAVSAGTDARTIVYINNLDDDNLMVNLYIDGVYRGGTVVSQNGIMYLDYYELSEGPHELKIRWRDPDTCEWQEKTEAFDALGSTVTLSVVPNSEPKCQKTAPSYGGGTATVYGKLEASVKNNDDDVLSIMLFVDGRKRAVRILASNAISKVLDIRTPIGPHTLKIKWREPDTNKWHEKTQEVIVGEDKISIILETDEVIYTPPDITEQYGAIDVYVENVDDDDLYVSVFVDSSSRVGYIESDTESHVMWVDRLHPGKHTIKLRWIDPDVHGWHEKKFEVYVGPNEEVLETFSTYKTTYVRKY